MFMNGLTALKSLVPPRAQSPWKLKATPKWEPVLNDTGRSLLLVIPMASPYFYDGTTPMSGETDFFIIPVTTYVVRRNR